MKSPAMIRNELVRLREQATSQGAREFADAVIALAEHVFGGVLDVGLPERVSRVVVDHARSAVAVRPAPPPRADGGVCRDCGGMTVPTGACSTCSQCGSTGGCG